MKRKKGFSLMEVMAAMFVVTAGLVVVIELFSKGIINSGMDRDRIVAAGLAQEGLEIVKNIRDNSLVIPGNSGFENFGPLTVNGDDDNQCGLDYTDTVFDNIAPNRNCFDRRNDPETKFSLTFGGSGFVKSATTTKWARVVYVFYNDNAASATFFDDSADVVSIVWWSRSSTPPLSVPEGVDITKAIIDANLSTCTAQSKCVYATMHIDAWKP